MRRVEGFGDNNPPVPTLSPTLSDVASGQADAAALATSAYLSDPLVAHPESPSSSRAMPIVSTSVVTLIEAVMLATTVPAALSASSSTSTTATSSAATSQTYSRPIYASPTAVSTGLLPPMGCDFGEALHVFAGTCCALQVVVRIIAESDELVNIFCHEAVLEGSRMQQLEVCNVGPLSVDNVSPGTVHLITLSPFVISASMSASRRLQIFDFHKKLCFTREWHFEVGMLNDDAIDWLQASHCSFQHLINPSSIPPASSVNGGEEGERPQPAEEPSSPRGRSSSPLTPCTPTGPAVGASQMGSFSASFLDVDEGPHHRLSRSESIITLNAARASRGDDRRQSTVDMIAQVGFWLYGTKFGQIMANASDPRENAKTFFSPSPIWLLGTRFVNDRWNPSQWNRVVCLGPVLRVVPFVAARLERLHRLPMAVPEGAYVLRELFSLRPVLIEALIPLLASWLEANGWEAAYELLEGPVLVLQAGLAASSRLSIILQAVEGDVLLDCRIVASPRHAMDARTCFVDILSELMSLISTEGRGATSLEFLLLRAEGISVEQRECPHPLIRMQPHLDTTTPLDTNARQVLLWSEHIHDWIQRELVHGTLPSQDGSSSTIVLFIRSPLMSIESMSIDIQRMALYIFDDGSRRLALSHVDTGSWFCFQAHSPEHFADLLHWFAALMRTAPSPSPSPSPSHPASHDEHLTAVEPSPSPSPSNVRSSSPPHSRPASTALASRRLGIPKRETHDSSNRRRKRCEVELGMDAFGGAFEALFWFTYRKDFPRLIPSILSSDVGFGCMIRAGQSMVAEALARLYLGRVRHLHKIFSDPVLTGRYKMVPLVLLVQAVIVAAAVVVV